jgi:cytochrome c
MRRGVAVAAWLLAAAAPVSAQDAAAGKLVFQQRCSSCHSVVAGQPHGIGPSLAGVGGRKAASTAFTYSDALRKSGLTWDAATLDRFLAGPSKLVPGTRMVVAVSDPKQRADLVAFLVKGAR